MNNLIFLKYVKISWPRWCIVIYWWLFILTVEMRDINICSLSKESTWRFVLVTRHYLFLCKARDHPFMDFIVICAVPECVSFLLLRNCHKLSNLKPLKFILSQSPKVRDQDTVWLDSLLKVWMGWNKGVGRNCGSHLDPGPLPSSLDYDGRIISLWLYDWDPCFPANFWLQTALSPWRPPGWSSLPYGSHIQLTK